MKNALVIKTYGDPATCKAIATNYQSADMLALKAECKRLRDKNSLKAYGDEKRFRAACAALDRKYAPEEHGWLYWTALRLWGLLWLGVYNACDLLDEVYGARE